MKKTGYIALAVVISALAVYFIFFSKLTFSSATRLHWKEAVPSNVSFVVVIQQPTRLKATIDSMEYASNLKTISFIDELLQMKSSLDSLQIKEKLYKKSIPNEIYASYHLAGVGNMEPIIYIPSSFRYRKLVKIMEELKAESKVVDEIWEYKGMKIFGYNDLKTGSKIYFTLAGGNLIFSRVAFLVEDAVSALSDGLQPPMGDELNNVFSETSNKSDLRLLFNFSNSKLFLSTLLNPEYLDKFSGISTLGNWADLDFYFNKNGIFYTGHIYADKQNSIIQYAGKMVNPAHVLPNNTGYYFSGNTDFDSEIKNSVNTWAGNTLVRFTTELYDNNFDKYAHYLLHIQKPDESMIGLSAFTDKEIKENEIYVCNSKGKAILGKVVGMNEVDNLFFCKLNNWLAISKDEPSLGLIKEKFLRDEVLHKELVFKELNNQLKEDESATIYFNVKNNKLLLSEASSIYLKSDFDSLFVSMTNFNQGLAHFKKSGSNSVSVMGYILQSEPISGDNQLVWKTSLDAGVKRVQVVQTNDGRFMILAQDTLNALYALSTGGNVLWKKQLESAIVGSVYDADFMSNGNKHYIFNTHRKIYRIDESGNDMEEFPIKLPDSTSQPLILIKSYSNKFMMFVQAGNGNLHGYEVNGRPLPGWNPVAGLKPLKFKARYFVEGGKGYIAAYTTDNKMHVFSESGVRAFPGAVIQDEFLSPFSVDISAAPLKLKNISKGGKVYSITNKGQQNSAQLTFSHPVQFYTLKDVIRNSDPEIVTAGENCVSVYSKTGEKIQTFCFESDFKDFQYQFVEKDKINENNYLIATSSESCTSYLIKISDKMIQEDVKVVPVCAEIVFSKLFDSPDIFMLSTANGELQVIKIQ